MPAQEPDPAPADVTEQGEAELPAADNPALRTLIEALGTDDLAEDAARALRELPTATLRQLSGHDLTAVLAALEARPDIALTRAAARHLRWVLEHPEDDDLEALASHPIEGERVGAVERLAERCEDPEVAAALGRAVVDGREAGAAAAQVLIERGVTLPQPILTQLVARVSEQPARLADWPAQVKVLGAQRVRRVAGMLTRAVLGGPLPGPADRELSARVRMAAAEALAQLGPPLRCATRLHTAFLSPELEDNKRRAALRMRVAVALRRDGDRTARLLIPQLVNRIDGVSPRHIPDAAQSLVRLDGAVDAALPVLTSTLEELWLAEKYSDPAEGVTGASRRRKTAVASITGCLHHATSWPDRTLELLADIAESPHFSREAIFGLGLIGPAAAAVAPRVAAMLAQAESDGRRQSLRELLLKLDSAADTPE